MDQAGRRKLWLALGTVYVIWGSTYLAIRVAVETLPPFLMAGVRFLIAGGLLLVFSMRRGEQAADDRIGWPQWRAAAIVGGLLLLGGNGGVVFAEQWVPSGLAAVMVATSPFWMSGVEATLKDGERLNVKTIVGLLIGFSGILVLVWPDLALGGGNRHFLLGIIALQIASFGWALGSAYSRRHARNDHILATTALQMLAGGVMMLGLGSMTGEWPRVAFNPRTLTSLVYLSTVGAIGGFVAYTYALRHLSMSFVSLYAYINPVIAVTLGVLLLGEAFDWRMACAAALVFVGVTVVRWTKSTSAATPVPVPLRRTA